ncbi:putative holin-like toxin [Effusibacillus consociatus]|uniref:Holin-like toxin n=1 Tax=Effusibacillus consociatus TaxID=1117041 RepID=A0ABV9Q227_9BACL
MKKGGEAMTVYEALTLMISFATLIATVIYASQRKK